MAAQKHLCCGCDVGVSLKGAQTTTSIQGRNTGAKARSKSQAEQVSLQLPLRWGMKTHLQQLLLCSSTQESSHHRPHTSTCCPHTSTCIGVVI